VIHHSHHQHIIHITNTSSTSPTHHPHHQHMTNTSSTSPTHHPHDHQHTSHAGIQGPTYLEANYTEGLLVGYRYYDSTGEQPLYPFGHGLSYTSFEYSHIQITGSITSTSNATITAEIKNAGDVDGEEVIQLYIGFPTGAGEPPKVRSVGQWGVNVMCCVICHITSHHHITPHYTTSQVLRGFKKPLIGAGQSTTVTFTLSLDDASIFDLVTDDWMQVKGSFGVMIGASSGDIRLNGSVMSG